MALKKQLVIIFVSSLILRLFMIFVAYHGDLNNNISWGTESVNRGLVGFYEGKEWPYSAPNQPPLTILMFWGLREIWLMIENTAWFLNNQIHFFPSAFIWFWEQKGMILLVKLPSIIADCLMGLVVYKYLIGISKKLSPNKILLIVSVWLFNPITWYNSAIWGQTDSVVNLLGLISVFALLRKNLNLSLVFLALSLLFKGSLAVFVPIVLMVIILQKYNLKKFLTASIWFIISVVLITFVFHPHADLPFWLFNLYKDRIFPGEIGYLTANAFNFWWLVDPGKVYDSVRFLGFPARILGFVPLMACSLLVFFKLRKNHGPANVLFSLAMIALTSFLFLTRIHERYLYPFFPLGTVLLGSIPQLWIPYFLLSIVHLINLYNLFWAPPIPFLEQLLKNQFIPAVLSSINLLVFVYLVYLFKTTKNQN